MKETQVQSLGWEDPLEKEMAIHSSTIAWRIPWTEEPDRLQFMGSQRVGHDWETSLSLSYFIKIKCAFSLRDIVKKMKTKAWDGKVYSSVCEYVSVHIQKDCI